jgi:hypothetical protein
MNESQANEAIGLLEALAWAIQDRETWLRVAIWNGSQKVPYDAVADLLQKINDVRKASEQAVGALPSSTA